MTQFTVKELASAIGAKAEGDTSLRLSSVSEPQDATKDQLAIATSEAFVGKLSSGQARAALLAEGSDWQALGLQAAILVKRPRFAMAALTERFDNRHRSGSTEIHPTAQISASAEIEPGAHIGAFSVIGAGARIGRDAWIGARVTVGAGVVIGDHATLSDGVYIGAEVTIGDRFIAQPGVVVGGDGFSFVTPEPSAVENVRDTLGDRGDAKAQSWTRIHSLGSVHVGNDVEMGANVCVDRGTIRDTRIGNGCKFDNLTQIGHNVVIGDNCLICAQVGIAGSSVLGNNVVLGGQTGVSDNVFVGDNAITGGATKVLANVPAGRVMLGYPAVKMDKHLEMYRALRRLPSALKDLAALKKSGAKPK